MDPFRIDQIVWVFKEMEQHILDECILFSKDFNHFKELIFHVFKPTEEGGCELAIRSEPLHSE
jgi:hypothetical protein